MTSHLIAPVYVYTVVRAYVHDGSRQHARAGDVFARPPPRARASRCASWEPPPLQQPSHRTGSLAFRASPNVSATTIRRGNLAPAHLTHTSRSLCVVAAEGGGKGKGKGKPKKEDNVYGHTVLLPKTDFEMRANSVDDEGSPIQQWWADNKIYEQIAERADAEMFTLHDGPPYANGDLH